MSSLRRHFGTAGLLVAIVALVAALGGGAYAANSSGDGATASAKKKNRKGKQGGLNAKQKRQVIAIAKRFQGTGPAGPQGVPGLPGAAGADGQNGSNGSNGSDGSDGSDGTNGKSVQTGTATLAECPEGGATVQVEGEAATKKKVCNGAKGATGDPWTAGGTLPEGATLTGTFTAPAGGEVTSYVPISFGIRLANPPTAVVVEQGEDKSAEGCSGTITLSGTLEGGVPVADAGKLCIYVAASEAFKTAFAVTVESASEQSPTPGADSSGALLKTENLGLGLPTHGMWAVGGDTPPAP